jgi:hypothetical protein
MKSKNVNSVSYTISWGMLSSGYRSVSMMMELLAVCEKNPEIWFLDE